MQSKAPSVAVVIPAYRVAPFVGGVVARVPRCVRHVIVVDDASPDDVEKALREVDDPRVVLIRQPRNGGVGSAMKTGFRKALDLGADIVVKVDGDGQMDPALIHRFIDPILAGEADFTKGNRFDDLAFISRMPMVRRIGNLALSFLVKLASGYWHLFDPCNGYLAISANVLRRMNLDRLEDRYFFEISLLCESYFAKAVLEDVPMQPVYGDEPSSLSPLASIGDFVPRLVRRSLHRLFMAYFMRDFNVVSVFVTAGIPSVLFGTAWSSFHWIRSVQTQIAATTGTVVIGMLGIVLGFQLLLQAVVLDVGNEPRRAR